MKNKTQQNSKKDFAIKKKEMYKNKEKLMSNASVSEKVVLYKENMTVGELAKELNVTSGELVKNYLI